MIRSILRKGKQYFVKPFTMFLVNQCRVLPIYTVFENTYGYDKSITEKKSVNHQGAIPWFTYPTIDYLSQLDLTNKTVFEWGSGNSSTWFAGLCKSIVSIEDNVEWFNIVNKTKKPNHTLSLAKDETEYVQIIHTFNTKFDIIIIDGKYRVECAREAIKYLNEGGMIILDNADWFKNTAKYLRGENLIEIDFHGLGPINAYTWTTSIFLDRNFNFKPLREEQPKSLPYSLLNVED
ncbi:SAM-dependent methyltransferase [Chitinophaga sp. SYP-B3965]|uniref:SAM-dependent methyltransferase n=1 Tax=Chitinophaga sp. SYP-B3965 TaxID=2663120 RepID=UPI001299A6A6|nr:SAM-dependent methyltransferase [Chitinophaga sp. SYP-B3965]MRG46928.1 SAM-dependent methyltransferase [Chitinophaga sp. SYP-B3965]